MERKRSVRRRYERPSLFKRFKECTRNLIAFLFSNVGIIGLVVGYTIAGAFIFQKIEGTSHRNLTRSVLHNRNETARLIWNITHAMNIFEESVYRNTVGVEMETYQKAFVQAVRKGYNGDNSTEEESYQWRFAGAFLYSLTVITTIGYGNVYPRTLAGQLTTIVYAIIGMPLFLLYLSNIGDVMARSFKWIYANLCLCRWCPGVARRRAERKRRRAMQMRRYEEDGEEEEAEEESESGDTSSRINNIPRANNTLPPNHNKDVLLMGDDELSEISYDDESLSSYDMEAVTVPVTICLAIMVGYICGGALLFSEWESWDFLDGSYFCFISLSTIGFGDIVPGDKIYKGGGLDVSFIICSMYLMLGMALIAMCFNLMQEEVIHKIRATTDTVKYMLRCNR